MAVELQVIQELQESNRGRTGSWRMTNINNMKEITTFRIDLCMKCMFFAIFKTKYFANDEFD